MDWGRGRKIVVDAIESDCLCCGCWFLLEVGIICGDVGVVNVVFWSFLDGDFVCCEMAAAVDCSAVDEGCDTVVDGWGDLAVSGLFSMAGGR